MYTFLLIKRTTYKNSLILNIEQYEIINLHILIISNKNKRKYS